MVDMNRKADLLATEQNPETGTRSCGCEQAVCFDAGVHRSCPNPGTTPCMYVGQLCDDCAETMRRNGGAEYLYPFDPNGTWS